MIILGFFGLLFFGFWAFTAVFWIVKIVEVARIPEQQFRAAQGEKITWVLIVVLAGVIGAAVWQFAKRDAVLAAAGGPGRAPAGWYPETGGGMRWWDGNTWTEARTPPV